MELQASKRRQATSGNSNQQPNSWASPAVFTGSFLFLVAVALGAFTQALSWDYWGGLVIAPIVVCLTVPLLKRTARRGDTWLARLLALGLVLKMGGAVARYLVGTLVYGGVADATEYVQHGTQIARQLRAGHLAVNVGTSFVGTGFLRLLTGIVFLFIGRSQLGGFVVFAWACFFGLYLFLRAFQISFPGPSYRRYALLIFLMPSLLYWPSSIGKDAFMVLTLGLAAHGAARMFTLHPWGWVEFALGLAGTTMVRPHIAAMCFLAVSAGYLVRPSRTGLPRPLGKAVGIVVLVVGGVIIVGQAQSFLKIESLNATSVTQSLGTTQVNSSEGNSAFTPVGSSPVKLPLAVVTAIFRPFPFEATGNIQQLGSSLEGAFLIVVFVACRKRIWRAIRTCRRQPYVMMVLVYTLGFSYIFASIGNFGILTRQRASQLFPIVFVLLAAPAAVRAVNRRASPVSPIMRQRQVAGDESGQRLTDGKGAATRRTATRR